MGQDLAQHPSESPSALVVTNKCHRLGSLETPILAKHCPGGRSKWGRRRTSSSRFHTAGRGGAFSGDNLPPDRSAFQVLPQIPSPWGSGFILGFILGFWGYTSVQSQAGMGGRLAGAEQSPECLIKEQGILENILESMGIREANIPSRGNPPEAQKRGLK